MIEISIMLTLGIALSIFGCIALLSAIPALGAVLYVVGELGSGPRFIYMGFAWLLSNDYRNELRQEYLNRNMVLAWIEYFLAGTCFVAWVVLIFYVSHTVAIQFI